MATLGIKDLDILESPDFLALPVDEQERGRREIFESIASDPEYIALPEDQKEVARMEIIGPIRTTPSFRPVLEIFPEISLRDAGGSSPFTGTGPENVRRAAPAPSQQFLEAREETAGKSVVQVAKELAFAPLVDLHPEVVAVASPAAQQINLLFGPEAAAGYSEAVAGIVSGMSSAGGVGALAVGAAGAVPAAAVGGLFSLDALMQSPEQAKRLRDAFSSKDKREIGRAVTESIALGFQAVGGVLPIPKAVKEIRGLPKTTQAVSEVPPVIPRKPIPITESSTGSGVGSLPAAFVEQGPTAIGFTPLRLKMPQAEPISGSIAPTPEMLAMIPKEMAETIPINTILGDIGAPTSPRRIRALIRAAMSPKDPSTGAIPLSAAVRTASGRTFFVDEAGNVVTGHQAFPEVKNAWSDLTLTERIRSEQELELQVARDREAAGRLEVISKTSPKEIEESLPSRPSMPQSESEQIATQFIQRVPSESKRGEVGFERPAAPPEVTRGEGLISGGAIEKWADETLQRGRSIGARPVSGEELLVALAAKGAAILERGYTSLPEWTQKMVALAAVEMPGVDISGQLREIRARSEIIRSDFYRSPETIKARENRRAAEIRQEQDKLNNLRLAQDTLVRHEQGITPPRLNEPVILNPLSRAESVRAFNQRFAFGKLKDWLKFDSDPIQQSAKAYFGEQFGMRPAFRNQYEISLRGKIDDAFEFNDKGEITNIGTKTSETSRGISDVMEELLRNPDSDQYILNTQQRQAVDVLRVERARIDKFKEEHGQKTRVDTENPEFDFISNEPHDNAYLSRVVVESPDVLSLPDKVRQFFGASVGRRVGGKQGIDKHRIFNTEGEGIAAGYKYLPSIEGRLVHELDSVYKKVFDERFANDSLLTWETPKAIKERTQQEYADQIASGEKTKEAVEQIALNRIARGRVSPGGRSSPAFQEKIFSADDAKYLNRVLRDSETLIRSQLAKLNRASKVTSLGFDFGVFLNQLLVTAHSHPFQFAKSLRSAVSGMVKENNLLAYYRDNMPAIREMAQAGHAIGETPDLIAGLGKNEWVQKVPVLREAFSPFERLFRGAMDIASVELWKSYRTAGMTPEQALLQMRTIESMIGQTRGLSQGKHPGRVITEQAAALAWTYYAGGLNLMGTLLNGGKPALIALRALGGYAVAMPMIFYAGAKALEAMGIMSDEEITEGFNPQSGKFLAWKVPIGDRHIYVPSPGAFYRSLIRLVGKMYRQANEDPSQMIDPIAQYAWSHSAPVPREVITAIKGEDVIGREASMAPHRIAERMFAPLAVREMIPPEQMENVTPEQRAAMAGVQFLGFSAFPESTKSAMLHERDKIAKERFSKSFEELPLQDQVGISKEIEKQDRFKPAKAGKPQIMRAIEADEREIIRFTKALNEDSRKLLKELDLRISGIDAELRVGKTEIPLSKEKNEQLENLVIAEYDKAIGAHAEALRKLPEDKRQAHLNKVLATAKNRAKAKLKSP